MSHDKAIPNDVQTALGVVVSKYLGGGCFKSVYIAVVTATGEEVVISSEKVSIQQETESLVLERIGASMPVHPHIIGPPAGSTTVPRLVADGKVYTVLQRCQCELFDCLAEHGGCVKEDIARGFFVQALAGLRFMHQNGIAHRDIKLENILIASDGRVKLIDFGLAHISPAPAPSHAPFDMWSASDVGTRSYVAPEVGNGRSYDTVASDVWSLGCTLFALTCGFFVVDQAQLSDPRFARMKRAQSMGQSTVRAVFSLYNRPCPLSAPLVQLLDGMLTIDPARRCTVDMVIASAWVREQYAPFLELEPTYRTELLNRRRASARWSRLMKASLGFGRALGVLRGTLEEVTYRPGHGGARAAASEFYADADLLDAMPPSASAMPKPSISRASSGGLGGVLPALPTLWRSPSGMSDDDDDMGPPVWRSATLDVGDPLGDAFSGIGDAFNDVVEEMTPPPQPPTVVRQKARFH